jgi:hypothetical protein
MIFTNPWGLLALLSIIPILGLHFFRSHRQVRDVGGLHLWQFAATRQPIGSRWTRLLGSLSLLFQLLAATVLALLIAGIDIPQRTSAEHYTIIVDDSASMTAQGTATPVERTRDVLSNWTKPANRYTLVAAGTRARVIAGPYAERSELLQQLDSWQPRAASCELSQAIQLASRFATGSEKMLFLTDRPDEARSYDDLLEVRGVGESLSNRAVVFADRVRVSPDQDRIFVTVQTFGSEPTECRLQVRIGGQRIDGAVPVRRLTPDLPDSFSFEVDALQDPVEITLPSDPLAADNRIVLAPVPVRNIRVFAEELEPFGRFLTRSVEATPFAFMEPDPTRADVVFCRVAEFPPPLDLDELAGPSAKGPVVTNPRSTRRAPFPEAQLDQYRAAALICAVPGQEQDQVAGVARGLDILADSEALITHRLPLEEGILWPFVGTSAPPSCSALLHTARAPLLFGGQVDPSETGSREFYYLNIVLDRTNIYQTSLFPILVRNLVEHTRQLVPGMARTNYRLGEQVSVSLDLAQTKEDEPIELLRNSVRYERFVDVVKAPRLLDDLEVGLYEFRRGDRATLARFSVNFFAPAESDLTGAATSSVDFSQLQPGRITRTATDHRLFLILIASVILLTGLSWISQDSAR